jgi:hypothetical protein
MSDSKKKIIPSKKSSLKTNNVVDRPDPEQLFTDALTVLANELSRFRGKTMSGRSLELKEARVFQGYLKSLVEMQKELRELNKEEDYSSFTDEELLKLVKKLSKDTDILEVNPEESSED